MDDAMGHKGMRRGWGDEDNTMKVILLMALTLDGKIGKGPDHFPDWTGKEDKKLFMQLSKQAGVLVMGSRTFDTIGSPLPDRKNIILTGNKKRVSHWDNLVFTDNPPRRILEDLRQEGYSQVILAGGATINSIFAREKLIDEIVVTISPKIFGTGISLFAEGISMELELLHTEKLGKDLIQAHYKVAKTEMA